jgi:rare lipoprotein A (peptidoglycan hydrolase)
MRPHLNLRAVCAMTALGALCLAISLTVLPGTAQSDDTTGTAGAHAAVAADIAPGKSRLNVLAGRRAAVNGRVLSGAAGRPALLQRHSGQGWATIDRAVTGAGGAFGFAFRPQRPGSAQLRVLVDAARREIGRLNVYRRAAVSWYGPGLYGNKLSCGGRLTPGTLGVAHKTLPCGTHVTLRKGDRVIRVRVVDRGPYVGGREFDLTSATRARLHFRGVGSLLVAS